MRNLTQVEGMSLDAVLAGIDWGFESFGEYMAQLRRKGAARSTSPPTSAIHRCART